jgi:2-hydroxychromene-2-carboxylate isomerase
MPADPTVEFWFSIASTYTYLSVTRLSAVECERGCRFVWRPFLLRTIMTEQDNFPFCDKPIKAASMWRYIERRAGLHKIPFRGPVPYPIQEAHLANRVAILGAREAWCADYAVATYRRWFIEFQELGSEPNLSETLREIGQDPDRVIAVARSVPIVGALDAATDQARPQYFWFSQFRRRSRSVLGRRSLRRCLGMGSVWHPAFRRVVDEGAFSQTVASSSPFALSRPLPDRQKAAIDGQHDAGDPARLIAGQERCWRECHAPRSPPRPTT